MEKRPAGRTKRGNPAACGTWGGKCPTHDVDLSDRNRKAASKAADKPERRAKLSEWGSLGFAAMVAKHGISAALKALARGMGQSGPEQWLAGFLDGMGVAYRIQVVIDDLYILDFMGADKDWVIEVDDGWREKPRPWGHDRDFKKEQMTKFTYLTEVKKYPLLYINVNDKNKEAKIRGFLEQYG